MAEFNASPSDENLVKRAKDGDKAAFEVFYHRHKRRILNYVYRMVGNIDSAEEITQEVFVKTYINLYRYIPQEKPLNWVYTIAGNLCKNFLRDRKLKTHVSLEETLPERDGLSLLDVIQSEGGTPSDLAMSKEHEELIQSHINSLPLKYKEVLILCDIQGYSYEEAAQILRCRVGSVGSRLTRARAILGSSLKKYMR